MSTRTPRKVNLDDMSPEDRKRFEAWYRHAYDWAQGPGHLSRDDSEHYAAWYAAEYDDDENPWDHSKAYRYWTGGPKPGHEHEKRSGGVSKGWFGSRA